MEKPTPALTNEKFLELASTDEGLHSMAYPKEILRCNGWKEDKILTFTYPEEYLMSVSQLAMSKILAIQRREEQLAKIVPGTLAFKAMGGDFNDGVSDSIGNHRIRCNFTNHTGHKYFVEIMTGINTTTKGYVDCVCDLELQEQREREDKEAYQQYEMERKAHKEEVDRIHKLDISKSDKINMICELKAPKLQAKHRQDYYLHQYENQYIDYTFTGVMEWINKTFDCRYDRCILFEYFVDPNEYVCISK